MSGVRGCRCELETGGPTVHGQGYMCTEDAHFVRQLGIRRQCHLEGYLDYLGCPAYCQLAGSACATTKRLETVQAGSTWSCMVQGKQTDTYTCLQYVTLGLRNAAISWGLRAHPDFASLRVQEKGSGPTLAKRRVLINMAESAASHGLTTPTSLQSRGICRGDAARLVGAWDAQTGRQECEF